VVEEGKGRNFPTRSFGGGVTVSDQKRMAKACQFYEQLLLYYPYSFRRHYGEMLALQFRDEYQDILKGKKPLRFVNFWVFVIIDFIRTFLKEHQEKWAQKANKDFFIVCAVAAGVIHLLLFLYGYFDVRHIFDNAWVIGVILGLFTVVFNLLTVVGFIKTSLKATFFRVFYGLILILAGYIIFEFGLSFIIVSTEWEWPIKIMNFQGRLIENEDRVFTYLIYCPYILAGIIGIGALVNRKWFPAMCLLAISLPMSIAIYLLYFQPLWLLDLSYIFSFAAYMLIGWWLKKETTPIRQPHRLRAA
jgi:hypothetical protein